MTIMAVLITTELAALNYTMKILSAVRTYVGGEGLWSKAQKNGAYYLIKYSYTFNESDYQNYLNFMKIPLSDHQARLALSKNPIDYNAARLGFLGGGIYPEDIDGIIWLFQRFNSVYYINKAIKIWSNADVLLKEFIQQGDKLHQSISANHLSPNDLAQLLMNIGRLNNELTVVENEFSYTLGQASRWIEHVVFKVLIGIAVTVELTGILLTMIIGLKISRNVMAINKVAIKVAKSDFTERINTSSKDEIGQLAVSFNAMIDALDKHEKLQTLSEKKFKSILEGAPDALVLINQDGVIVMMNAQTEAVFGYTKQEIIEKHVEFLIPEGNRIKPADYRKYYVKNPHAQAMGANITLYGLRKNGNKFPIEISLSPIETDEGILALAAIRDVTDKINNEKKIIKKNKDLEKSLEKQRQVSQELAERSRSLEDQTAKTNIEQSSKNLLLNILESSTEYSIVATDLSGGIVVWNEGASRLYGYHRDEMVHINNVRILFSPEDSQSGRVNEFFETVLHDEKNESIFERIRKDGSRFFSSFVATLRRDSAGNPVGYDMIDKDITKQKKLEDQLIKTNQELEQFAYITSHDLKAPLRSIERLTSWIEEDCAERLDEKSKENLVLLRRRVNRMSNLISGILEYSRTGHLDLQIHSIDTKHLVQGIIDTINPSKKFNIQYADNLPMLETDDIQLSQVFSNLMDNSIKHNNHEAGKIEIGVRDLGDFYEFFVKDNGPGIAPEYHKKIFEIFQTLKSRDELESTGIGLSIVKKIVESNGGEIKVDSVQGAGATFYFTWPKNHPIKT